LSEEEKRLGLSKKEAMDRRMKMEIPYLVRLKNLKKTKEEQ